MSEEIAAAVRKRLRSIADHPQPGVMFADITPVLADSKAFALVVDHLVAGHIDSDIDKVAGIEARGFVLAAPVAYLLDAGLVPLRKEGKLPAEKVGVQYALEYGTETLEMHSDAFEPGERVLLIDDVLATGGTSAAAIELIEGSGAVVVGLSFMIEISGLGGRESLSGRDVAALVQY